MMGRQQSGADVAAVTAWIVFQVWVEFASQRTDELSDGLPLADDLTVLKPVFEIADRQRVVMQWTLMKHTQTDIR